MFIVAEKKCTDLPGYYPEVTMPVGVAYCPEKKESVFLWTGRGNSNVGGCFSPTEIMNQLEKREEHFRLAGAEWFVPYIDRMAQGEEVLIGDIQDAYRSIHGKELPKEN